MIIFFDNDRPEICRFVRGGTRFIDNRAFNDKFCAICLRNDRLLFKNINHPFTLYRTPNWGWRIISDGGHITLLSYDKAKGTSSDQEWDTCNDDSRRRYFDYDLVPLTTTLLRFPFTNLF